MNEKRRVKSIAKRMGRSWAWRLFFVFVFLDAVIAVLCVAGFCYASEIAILGGFHEKLVRWFEVDTTGNIRQMVESCVYWFQDLAGTPHSVPMADYLMLATPFGAVLIGVQLFILLFQGSAGRRSASRALKPLMQISRTAERLSSGKFDEARFLNLEHAIESISPTTPGARLRTGDREMVGLETAVNNLLTRMHESYKEQMRFVSDASHELRTPIAVIQGYSSMLSRWGKTDEKILDESIAAIKTEAEHMNKLVEQLLFLARGDSGRTELALAQFNLGDMLREVYDEYKMIDQKHEYTFVCQGEVLCTADPALVKQVARILTDNAIKYSPEGNSITLRVMDGAVPAFQVQDNGIGIDEADVPHIFERFFRSDPSRGRATGGTGLGLSIAKWIVDRHGGYFEVLSRPGLGTRITVFLPEPPKQP